MERVALGGDPQDLYYQGIPECECGLWLGRDDIHSIKRNRIEWM